MYVCRGYGPTWTCSLGTYIRTYMQQDWDECCLLSQGILCDVCGKEECTVVNWPNAVIKLAMNRTTSESVWATAFDPMSCVSIANTAPMTSPTLAHWTCTRIGQTLEQSHWHPNHDINSSKAHSVASSVGMIVTLVVQYVHTYIVGYVTLRWHCLVSHEGHVTLLEGMSYLL